MAPKLYGDIRSPCVRAVLLTIKALNIEVDYVHIDVVKKEHLTAEYLKINPRHTVPSLEDNGFIVWDSHAIMVYLAEKFGKNNSIYPENSQKRAIINQMLFFETGDIFAIHRYITYNLIHKGNKEPEKDPVEVLEKGYEHLETFLKNSKYLTGPELTIADFSFWTTLSNSQVLVPINETKYPRIIEWFKLMDSLPYRDLNETGRKEFVDLIHKILKI